MQLMVAVAFVALAEDPAARSLLLRRSLLGGWPGQQALSRKSRQVG